MKLLLVGLGIATAATLVVDCGGSGGTTTAATPTANHPPVITSVSVSPTGTGMESVTNFAFTAQGASDPDGDALTYAWTSSDGTAIGAKGPSMTYVYGRSGAFDMRVTVTDPKGLSASAAVSVRVGNLTGVWDVSCNIIPGTDAGLLPSFPSQFVVSMTQIGTSLNGTMSAAGRSMSFTYPGTITDRAVSFGFESPDIVWARTPDGRQASAWPDFYFGLTVDDTLTTMAGSSKGYCSFSAARRRG